MRLLRGDGPLLRIGHRAALAPENTLASLRAHDLVERSLVSSVDAAALAVPATRCSRRA